jgi:hypothetical protein
MKIEQEDGGEPFGDSDFLAMRDLAVQDFRAGEMDFREFSVVQSSRFFHRMGRME